MGPGGWVFSRVGGFKALDPPPPVRILQVSSLGTATPSFLVDRSLVKLCVVAPFLFVVFASTMQNLFVGHLLVPLKGLKGST